MEVPSFEAPTFEAPKLEVPKVPDMSKFKLPDAPKVEVPSFEAPKIDTSKFKLPDAPKVEVPSFEAPTFEAPKLEVPKKMPSVAAPKIDVPDVSTATKKLGTVSEAAREKLMAARRLKGTAAETFTAAAEKEAAAAAARKEADNSAAAARRALSSAKKDAAKADALWATVSKAEAKAKDLLVGADAAAAKAATAQRDYAARLGREAAQKYAEAKASDPGANAKEAAQRYADAGALNLKIKQLPSLDTVDSYPAVLSENSAKLDSGALERLRQGLAAAMVDAAASGQKFEAACAQARAPLSTAFKGGSKQGDSSPTGAYAGMLDAAREAFDAADAEASRAVEGLAPLVKEATAVDNGQRAAARAIVSVRLSGPAYAAAAQDIAPIGAAQTALKPVGNQALAAEKSARGAQRNVEQAKKLWGEAKKGYSNAEALSITAEKLYNEASKLGAEEAELFGEAL